MNRREIFGISGAGAVALLSAGASTAAAQAAVQTGRHENLELSGCYVGTAIRSGKVRGIDVGGIKRFLGLPYGGSTGGVNRFMPPTPVRAWAGVRDAYGYGPICPQPFFDPRGVFGGLFDGDQQPSAHSEDCLNLNVWTPGLRDGAKRAVMVYLHGGGMSMNSANYPYYMGDRLARFGDVVVVTVNHRLGALGYLDLIDIGAPSDFARSGNAGMLDLVQALEWVRDNIEVFGGDPGRVMIFGQSGGGQKTNTLMAMPAAKGLFHRAANQSGIALKGRPRELASKDATRLLRQLNLRKGDFKKLQEVPFEQIIAAQIDLGCFGFIGVHGNRADSTTVAAADVPSYSPVVDGIVFPQHPFDPAAAESGAHVPMIAGCCLHDAAWAIGGDLNVDDAGLKQFVERLVGPAKGEQVIDAYLRVYPNTSPFLLKALMLTDRGVGRNVDILGDRRYAQRGASTWIYRFAWPSAAIGGQLGSFHASDIGFVFHNNHMPFVGGDTYESRAVSDLMAGMWVAFAKTGSPNGPGLPEWPEYTSARRETMVINRPHTRVVGDPNGQFRDLWNAIDQG